MKVALVLAAAAVVLLVIFRDPIACLLTGSKPETYRWKPETVLEKFGLTLMKDQYKEHMQMFKMCLDAGDDRWDELPADDYLKSHPKGSGRGYFYAIWLYSLSDFKIQDPTTKQVNKFYSIVNKSLRSGNDDFKKFKKVLTRAIKYLHKRQKRDGITPPEVLYRGVNISNDDEPTDDYFLQDGSFLSTSASVKLAMVFANHGPKSYLIKIHGVKKGAAMIDDYSGGYMGQPEKEWLILPKYFSDNDYHVTARHRHRKNGKEGTFANPKHDVIIKPDRSSRSRRRRGRRGLEQIFVNL